MFPISIAELIGYMASIFIVLSMMQSKLDRVRLYMMGGCIAFIIYGLAMHAWPVAVANSIIFFVTLFYYLRDLRKDHKDKTKEP